MKSGHVVFFWTLITLSLTSKFAQGQTSTPLYVPSVAAGQANNVFLVGTGDGADLTTYNTFLKLHSGMAIGSPFVSNGSGGYVQKATIAFDARWGTITAQGNFISSGGKLGLGVATPLNAVDVLEPFAAGTETTAFIGQNHNFGANTGRYGIGLSFQHLDGTSAGKRGYLNFWFGNERKRVLSINYLGYVGMGCSNPDTQLTVKGTIHTDEVRVDVLSTVCPDYVFEKNYSMASLEELERYLNENKHLPEVPSAKEMEANGLLLKEMNLLLLKKIEELTLHVIALNKDNASLKLENDESKQRAAAINERLTDLETALSKLQK